MFKKLFRPNVEKLTAKKDVNGLIKALADSDEAISKSAAEALGEIGGKSAVPALINSLAQGEMRFVTDLDGAPPLTKGVVLGKLADATHAPTLIDLLTDSRVIVREGAAEALGGIGDKRAIAPLINLLQDSDKGVRCAAIRALGKTGDKSAVLYLVKILEQASELSEVSWAAWALGSIGDKGAVPSLIKALKEKQPPTLFMGSGNIQIRILPKIVGALEELGDKDAIPALTEVLSPSLHGGMKKQVENAINKLKQR